MLSTWFVDKLTFAPYLCIYGPQGSGKTTLLRLLHCLCRRSVLIAGPIPPAIHSLPALLRPTLLLDELQFNGTHKAQTLECWLRAGNSPGVPVAMGGHLVDGFGAKVLCSRQPVVDTALASRALHISMVPLNNNSALLPLAEDDLQEIAAIQSLLLTFRLLHYWEFGVSYDSSFVPRMEALAGALMLPFWEDQETHLALREALAEQNRDAHLERQNEPECLVIWALFDMCHQENASKVFCGQIASRINATLKSLGEEADLKPRAVGAKLKTLGLKTGGLGNIGRGLKLTSAVRARIHELAQAYGMRPSSDPKPTICSLCMKTFGGPSQAQTKPSEDNTK